MQLLKGCENLVTKFQMVVEKMKVILWYCAYFILKVWNIKWNHLLDNFVAWDEQIIVLKTASKSVQNGRDITDWNLVRCASEFDSSSNQTSGHV